MTSTVRFRHESGSPQRPPTPVPTPGAQTAADTLRPLIRSLLGEAPPVRLEFWDGSHLGPHAPAGVVRVHSRAAVRRILWSPDELGIGRAYVAGDIDVDGDIFALLTALRDATPENLRFGLSVAPTALHAAGRLGVLKRPLPPPPEEARPRGLRHSKARDARAIGHHYDVGNDFYRIVLGPAMTYSCARFATADMTLEEAQAAKHELICRKLGLHERPGMQFLDVGCGWGSLAMHAATRHGARAVGITISEQQVALARERVAAAGLSDQVEIRLQDYRDLRDERFDAIASVGMFEHVGAERMAQYFETLHGLLLPRGRLLNHAISSVDGSKLRRRSFVGRYVFPDGELLDVADLQRVMEKAGFEVRDVESLREHYSRTLRQWVANLEARWDDAVAAVGAARARVWRLYMAGSAIGFEDGGLSVHQVLGVKTDSAGVSGMPRTRRGWD